MKQSPSTVSIKWINDRLEAKKGKQLLTEMTSATGALEHMWTFNKTKGAEKDQQL